MGTVLGCVELNQSNIIEKPAIDSINDTKKATSIVMTHEELAKLKSDIKEEIMKDMPKPSGDKFDKMADRGNRRRPPGGESDDRIHLLQGLHHVLRKENVSLNNLVVTISWREIAIWHE